MITGATAWLAFEVFPFPFVVAYVPLLFAAAHVRPAVVALLGSACTVEMTMIGRFAHTARPEVGDGAIVVAAALTGVLPIALALMLDELEGERHLLARTGEHLRRVLAGVVGWNDKIAGVTGFSAEEIVGRSFAAFFAPGARASGLPDALLEHAATHGRTENIGWRIRGDGRSYWASTVVEATRNSKGEIVGFTRTVQDQSELQRSESALPAAERRSGFALGSGGQGIWEIDPIAGRMHYSDVYAAMLGLPAAILRDDPAAWKARVHPDDVGRIPPDDAGDEAGETELRPRHADGHWTWVADRRRVAERDETGRPTRVIGTHVDITARKLAEEKFRLAVEASPNGLLIADAEGRITLVNREIERMLGYADGTLLGHSIDDLVPEAQRAGHTRSEPTPAAWGRGTISTDDAPTVRCFRSKSVSTRSSRRRARASCAWSPTSPPASRRRPNSR